MYAQYRPHQRFTIRLLLPGIAARFVDGADANGHAGPVDGAGASSTPEGAELLDPANDIQLTRRNSFEVGRQEQHASGYQSDTVQA